MKRLEAGSKREATQTRSSYKLPFTVIFDNSVLVHFSFCRIISLIKHGHLVHIVALSVRIIKVTFLDFELHSTKRRNVEFSIIKN